MRPCWHLLRSMLIIVCISALGFVVALVFGLSALEVGSPASSPDPPLRVAASVDIAHPGAPVPRGFLGLSFEMSSLADIARYGVRGNMVALLRSLGPGLMRFGGITSDTATAFTDALTPLPHWASQGIDAREFRELRVLAARSGWHVLLTIGLAHLNPSSAAREAAAAKRSLGPWLAGVELGNEPDAYARHGLRSLPWTATQYDADVAAYRHAIDIAAPGLRVSGPDVSGSKIFPSWAPPVALHDGIDALTGHHYPMGCNSVPPPTISRLLSPAIRHAETVSLRRYLTVSSHLHIPFRLDETNSVSCGGTPGISDRFASALWAIDYIAHTMTSGASGINLQASPSKCLGYTPFCAPTPKALASGSLVAHPEWYALLMARGLVGERPVHVTIMPTLSNVDVLAFAAGSGALHLLLLNDEPNQRVVLRLRLPHPYRPTTSLSLTAPSLASSTGVRLVRRALRANGQSDDASSRSPRATPSATPTIELPPSTATLLTLRP